MNHSNRFSLRPNILKKITMYNQKITELGVQARQLVFGFRRRSTAHIDRSSLPVKLLYDHRLLQRQRVFLQAGGHRSSIALHALNKARLKK